MSGLYGKAGWPSTMQAALFNNRKRNKARREGDNGEVDTNKYLLKEDDGFLLMESGDKFLMEDQNG